MEIIIVFTSTIQSLKIVLFYNEIRVRKISTQKTVSISTFISSDSAYYVPNTS